MYIFCLAIISYQFHETIKRRRGRSLNRTTFPRQQQQMLVIIVCALFSVRLPLTVASQYHNPKYRLYGFSARSMIDSIITVLTVDNISYDH